MPRTDRDLTLWMQIFLQNVSDIGPAVLSVTADELTTLTSLAQAFEQTLEIASSNLTRTSHTIALKDQARRHAELAFRELFKRLKADPALSDTLRIRLGLPTSHRQRNKPRLAAPSDPPLLHIVMARHGSHILRYADFRRPELARKPQGITHLEAFYFLNTRPLHCLSEIPDPAQGTFIGAVTRSPFTVEFKPEADGLVATYIARWAGRAGRTSPWSLPVSMVVCGTSATAKPANAPPPPPPPSRY